MVPNHRASGAENYRKHGQGDDMTAERTRNDLPAGRNVKLPGRGTTFVREAGPRDAPTLLLLHGWTANADLNWRAAYPALSDRFHIVAPDQRGHARGIRDTHTFRLEDCADDAAALVDTLGLERVIPVGYSMGGPIAQLLWRRHPCIVDALVLCATSRTFNGTRRERAMFGLLSGASATARHMTDAQRAALAMRLMNRRSTDVSSWTSALETMASHDWMAIIEAGRAIGRFDSTSWASTIDVPTGVVVTTRDRVVPSWRQLDLAAAIPGATVHPVNGDHAVCLAQSELFVPQLLEAIDSVVARTQATLVAA
jgi:3-oxoadipate enol-lactonase